MIPLLALLFVEDELALQVVGVVVKVDSMDVVEVVEEQLEKTLWVVEEEGENS